MFVLFCTLKTPHEKLPTFISRGPGSSGSLENKSSWSAARLNFYAKVPVGPPSATVRLAVRCDRFHGPLGGDEIGSTRRKEHEDASDRDQKNHFSERRMNKIAGDVYNRLDLQCFFLLIPV